MVPRDGTDNFAGSKIGRPKAARKVHAKEGAHQTPTSAFSLHKVGGPCMVGMLPDQLVKQEWWLGAESNRRPQHYEPTKQFLVIYLSTT